MNPSSTVLFTLFVVCFGPACQPNSTPVDPSSPGETKRNKEPCEKVDRLEIFYSADPRPNNPAQSYRKSHAPSADESAAILEASIGVVDGKTVTIRDYFDSAYAGRTHEFLKQKGIKPSIEKPTGGTTAFATIHCAGLTLTDSDTNLNSVNWSLVYQKADPPPRRPEFYKAPENVPLRNYDRANGGK